MKKKRFFIILSLSFLVVFVFVLSSSIFTLKNVEIVFLDENNSVISTKNNKIYNTYEKIENIKNTANFDYGSSVFLLNKDVYINRIDSKNAYLKLLGAQLVFPNKLVIKVKERAPKFYIKFENYIILLDEDFKILEQTNSYNLLNYTNIIEFAIKNKNGQDCSFFEFFGISNKAFEVGQYLSENNLVLLNLKNLIFLINKFNILKGNIKEVCIFENVNNTLDLFIYTNNNLGITLNVKNIFNRIDEKLSKLLYALNTLYYKENIKTTYGVLKIDENLNCFWNKL